MFTYQITRKGIVLTIMLALLGLLLASSASAQNVTALTGVPEQMQAETEIPRVWPHLEVTAAIAPAPIVGQEATVRIEVVSALDEEQVTIFTQMSPEIDLADGNLTWAGPVQANTPFTHEFKIALREPGQWVIYVSVGALSGAWDGEQLYITSTAVAAEVVSSAEYHVFQSKEEWPGNPAELVPHRFPQHPEPAVNTETDTAVSAVPVTVEGTITFGFEYEDCLPGLPAPCPGIGPGVFPDKAKLRNAQVWLYDRTTDDDGHDHYLAATTTNDDGFYSFTVENDDPDGDGTGIDPLITIFPAGPEGDEKVLIVDEKGTAYFEAAAAPDDDLIDGSTYTFDHHVSHSLGRTDKGQVMYIFDQIANEAYSYLQNVVGWDNDQVIKVNYPQGCIFGAVDNSCYLGAVDGISIYNVHGRRADVIIHEYGHFVLSRYLGDIAVIHACAPVYNHSFTEPTIRPACAWSEGWADFLQMAVQNDPDQVGRDLETPAAAYLPPPGEEPARWEGVVAATLWDIFDPAGGEGSGYVDPLDDGLNGPADNGIWQLSTQLPSGDLPHTLDEFLTPWGLTRVLADHTAVCDVMSHYRFLYSHLDLSTAPPGAGTFQLEPPVHCPNEMFVKDSPIDIWPVAEPGFLFSHWSGDASGDQRPLTVWMDGDKNITAEYIVTGGDYMTRLSTAGDNVNPAIANDGRYIAYYHDGNIMRYDRLTDPAPVLVASASGAGVSLDISDDGRYIAYTAVGPVHYDVFLYDHQTGASQNLTNHPDDPAVSFLTSWDISVVQTGASLLVGYTTFTHYTNQTSAYRIWLYDSASGGVTEVNPAIGPGVRRLRDISANGNEILLRGYNALFVYDRANNNLHSIQPPLPTYAIAGASFSDDGRYVVYDLHQEICSPGGFCHLEPRLYWHDRTSGTHEEITYFPTGEPVVLDYLPRVSNDGNYVFYSEYSNNIFRFDRSTNFLQQVTLTTDGGYPDGPFFNLSVSGDGRFATFSTNASNLVPGDTNGTEDVFLADMDFWNGMQPELPDG